MMSVQMQRAETDMTFFSSSKSNITTVASPGRVTARNVKRTKPRQEPAALPLPPSSSPAQLAPSSSPSVATSPFSSPLSSPSSTPPQSPGPTRITQKKTAKTKRKSPESEIGPTTAPDPSKRGQARPSKKIRVDSVKKRVQSGSGSGKFSRASSRAASQLASSPLEPIFRRSKSSASRSRSTSSFPSAPAIVTQQFTRNWTAEDDGDPGPSHISSERVVKGLHKSYKGYFKNPDSPDDNSFEPEAYPTAELEYPNTGAFETFSLLAPKDKDHYNPIMDLEKSLYTIQSLIGLPPSDSLTEALSPPPSPSPSPPNSRVSKQPSHGRDGSLSSLTSLESTTNSSSSSQHQLNYCRAVQRAINTKDGPLLLKSMSAINTLLRSFKYPDPPTDPFDPISPNSLKRQVDPWTQSGGIPSKVLHRILEENYQRSVGPNIAKLRKYEAFTSQVYGELLPSLVEEIVCITGLNENSLFMDLGSGVGNVVVQAAVQTGCRAYGVELSPGPAQVAKESVEQFKIRCRMWGVGCGEIEVEEGDMLASRRVEELLPLADVVLVDNKVFEESLNEALRPKFLDLKEGAVVISLKPFVSSLNGLNARVTERNVDDISAIFDVTERPYYPGAVSWGNGAGSYYIHRVDREGYAEIRQKFESTTRGKRSAAKAKYVPSRNTDESDWFGGVGA
ncbi:hypothetical protein D9757_007288 [Collybiopsis confluens]|uniref:Histone-lysine N-methyltransferase, H3 lysine-79 specific n=1 Tax=Collybiopsis confluens TaxID=2823264 RepID=A0A8H5HFX1_9AGAR|nr:hypothetical protein D9757_007288 [Collybiopsis confluens]